MLKQAGFIDKIRQNIYFACKNGFFLIPLHRKNLRNINKDTIIYPYIETLFFSLVVSGK